MIVVGSSERDFSIALTVFLNFTWKTVNKALVMVLKLDVGVPSSKLK